MMMMIRIFRFLCIPALRGDNCFSNISHDQLIWSRSGAHPG